MARNNSKKAGKLLPVYDGVPSPQIIGAVPVKIGKKSPYGVNVSSYGPQPFNSFSPFNYDPSFEIPVPGMEGAFSHSVESIWQGLKIIGGRTDFRLFQRNPKKRRGDIDGHLFGGDVLGLVDARKNIYVPAYSYFLENCVGDDLKQQILLRSLATPVLFYDVDSNLDIEDTTSPFAHSAVLAEYFRNYREKLFGEERQRLDVDYDESRSRETLAEPVARALNRLETSSDFQKKVSMALLNSPLSGASKHKRRFYDRVLEKLV